MHNIAELIINAKKNLYVDFKLIAQQIASREYRMERMK